MRALLLGGAILLAMTGSGAASGTIYPAKVECHLEDGQVLTFNALDHTTSDGALLIWVRGNRETSSRADDTIVRVYPSTRCLAVPKKPVYWRTGDPTMPEVVSRKSKVLEERQ